MDGIVNFSGKARTGTSMLMPTGNDIPTAHPPTIDNSADAAEEVLSPEPA